MSIRLKDTIYDLINNSDKLDGKDSSAFSLTTHTHSNYAQLDHTHSQYLTELPSHSHNYASTVKIGNTSYNSSNNVISLPAYPTLNSLGAASSSHTHSYLPLSGGTMTGGNISWEDDSHGIYFRNGCGIEKWHGYEPSLVAEVGTNFYVSNKTDRSINYLILHTGNYGSYCAPKTHSHSYLPLTGGTITTSNGVYVMKYNSTDGEFCTNSYLINDIRKADIGYLKDSTRAAVYIYNSTGGCGLAANDDGEVYKINATDFKLNKLWHQGNHGASSGLNADLLDGSHGTAFTKTVKIGSISYNASSSVISLPAYPTSLKNPASLTIQANGTSLGSYDGSSAKTINITYSNVGAASSGHNHDSTYLKLIGGSLSGKLTVDTGSTYSISLGTYTSWAGGSYPTIKSNSSDSWVMLINPHICADDMNSFAKTSCIRMESPDGNPWDITAGNNGECSFKISEYSTSGSTYIRSSYLRINNSASSLGTLQVNGTKHPIIYGNGTYLTLGYTDAVSNSDYGIVIERSDVRPTTTNTRSLGLSNYIWTNIFSNSCNINYGQFNENLVICKNTSRALVINSASWTWAGLSSTYPIMYTQPNSGTDSGDRYIMIAMPHIPYLKKSTRSYTGNTYGAVIRFESDASTTATYWDCGVITADVFGIKRGTKNYFTLGTNGAAFTNENGATVRITSNSRGTIDTNSCIELMSGTGYIDWHYNGSSEDFTSRIIESSSGILTVTRSLNVGGTFSIGGEQITFTT